MATTITLIEKSKTSPLGLFLIGALSIAALAASARIQVPMIPVPITLQTAVVLILPCLLGWRIALGILAAYFAAGAAGLPVFAGVLAGPAYFVGPTGGYLLGFAVAMSLTGIIFERKAKWSFLELGGLMLAAHMIILALGAFWLAFGAPMLGMTQALATGVYPFVIGSVLKAGLAAAAIKAATK